jgi:hypothetical protein
LGGGSIESANPDLIHPQAAFAEPLPYGYVYVGMTVDPPGRAPFVRWSAKREEALEKLKIVAGQLEALEEVVRATIYRAVLIPPIEGAPRFDVTVLLETTSPEEIDGVRSSGAFERLGADFVMGAQHQADRRHRGEHVGDLLVQSLHGRRLRARTGGVGEPHRMVHNQDRRGQLHPPAAYR